MPIKRARNIDCAKTEANMADLLELVLTFLGPSPCDALQPKE